MQHSIAFLSDAIAELEKLKIAVENSDDEKVGKEIVRELKTYRETVRYYIRYYQGE